MRKKLLMRELRDLLQAAIETEKQQLTRFEKETNPQVIKMRLFIEGKLDAFLAVQDALSGDAIPLRMSHYDID